MAKEQVHEEPSAVERAIVQLAELQQEIRDNQPLRQRTFAEDQAKDPDPEMPFPLFQNGYRIEAHMLGANNAERREVLALVAQLQVGRFFDRKIHVYRDGSSDQAWHIDYDNRSISARMDLMQYGRNFPEILARLIADRPDRS